MNNTFNNTLNSITNNTRHEKLEAYYKNETMYFED